MVLLRFACFSLSICDLRHGCDGGSCYCFLSHPLLSLSPPSQTTKHTHNINNNITDQGLDSPIKIDHTVLKFASCCPGDKISHSLFATNTTNSPQTFEVAIPRKEQSFLRITPNVETLDPGASCRLEIEYSPPASMLKLEGGKRYSRFKRRTG